MIFQTSVIMFHVNFPGCRFQTYGTERVTKAEWQRAISAVNSKKMLKRLPLHIPMLPVLCCADISPPLPLAQYSPRLNASILRQKSDALALPLGKQFGLCTNTEACARKAGLMSFACTILYGRCMHGYANCGVYYIYHSIYIYTLVCSSTVGCWYCNLFIGVDCCCVILQSGMYSLW